MKEAVRTAVAFIGELVVNANDVRLEEVDRYGENGNWEVVLSFVPGGVTATQMLSGRDPRVFKSIFIDGASGEPLSLKVWNGE